MTPPAAPINQAMGPAEWAMLVLLSVIWGGSFFFTGVAVTGLPPFTIVLLRVAIAALVLNLVVPLTGQAMPRDGKSWAAFFGMGLLNNAIPFSLIVWGQTHIASGLASILNAMTPVATVIVAHVLTRDEKMTGNRLLGVLVGLAGVVCMIGPAALSGLGDNVLAQAAVLGATVSYAFSGIYGRRFRTMGISPLATATGQVTASSVLVLPLVLVVDRPWTLVPPAIEVWGAVLGLALLSTTFAYILFFRIMARAGATNLSLVTFLIPVSAILLGTLVLNETLQTKHFLGMALIAAGLVAIDGRLLNRLRR